MTRTEGPLDLASQLWKQGGQGIWSRWDSTWSTGYWRQSAPLWFWSRRTGSSPSSTSWWTHVAPPWYFSQKCLFFCMSMFFLVYYLGIEDNRRQARENFQSHVRIFKRRKVDSKKLKSKHWLEHPTSLDLAHYRRRAIERVIELELKLSNLIGWNGIAYLQ